MIRALLDKYFIKQPRLRRIITRAVYGDADKRINLVGMHLTINALRENGYLRAAAKCRGSIFLEHEINVLLRLAVVAGRCDCFIDAGANIGVFSQAMARRRLLDPGFRIMAFEPHPETFQRLVKNVQQFGIETYNVALSDRETRMKFVDGAVSHVFTAIEHQNKYNIAGATFDIECRRLDTFPNSCDSILLKIDVEGHEHQVLQGAHALFVDRRVAAVYCDGHDSSLVPEFLKAFRFELFDIADFSATAGDTFGLLGLRAGLFQTR